jgi:hypothetical protein
MAYLVRITEWKIGGREFLIPYAELPTQLAQAIAEAKPISSVARSISEAVPEFVSSLNSEICRIVDMSQQPDSRALDLGA